MQFEIKVDGKTVQFEITEEQLKELGAFEQLKKLGLIEEQRTGYERVKKDEMYYVINTKVDSMINVKEFKDETDEQYYNIGNYYSNKTIAENNARADRLLRQLRRWQAQHDKAISISDWKNDQIDKYCITYGYGDEKLYVDHYYIMRLPNTIYFATKEKAEEAIEVFKDELIWYFTEYVQRLDEMQND